MSHDSGIIVACAYSRAVMRQNGLHYLFDSHGQEDDQNAALFTFTHLNKLVVKVMSHVDEKFANKFDLSFLSTQS